MGRTSVSIAIAIAVVTGAVCGCKKKKKSGDEAREVGPEAGVASAPAITWAIAEVGIELVAEQGSERDLDAQKLARRIGSELRATDYFTTGEGEVPDGRTRKTAQFRARVTYGIIPEGSIGSPSAFVAVEGVLSPDDASEMQLRDNVVTERPLAPNEKGADTDSSLAEQVDRAVGEMIAGVIAKEALRGAGPDTLREALMGEVDLVQWALSIVADRKLQSLAEPVRALLRSADNAIADAAISAAVALEDSKAVKLLTEGIDFQDHERMRVVIEASAALGGSEALQFLEFVSTGHEDDDIKAHAADAIERLKRRR